MKTTRIFTTLLAALMLTAIPFSTVLAEETTDSATHKKTVIVRTKGSKGRPITDKEKDVAKEMAKKGAQMGSKGVKLALNAITNPSKADSLSKEMDKLGEEMERLGDSLESMSEDTTFLYEGEDEDTILLSDDDFDEIAEEFSKNFHFEWPSLFGGALGIFGGILGIMIAIFVILLLFGIFTSPLWILALIIWLIVRNNRRNNAGPTMTQTTSTGERLATEAGTGAGTGAGTATASNTAANAYMNRPYPDENREMWKNGIMNCCIGVGLILLFISIGLDGLWGIGALVACIGVAKLVIASTTKGKDKSGTQNNVSGGYPGGTTSDITPDDNYEK